MELKELVLPSGAVLKINPAPFADSRNLYQAVMEEFKVLKLDPAAEVDVNFMKDLLCTGLSSKKIELALTKCMQRATYNDLKITDATFEALEARDDYLTVCFEVAKENILPFMKSLYAQFAPMLEQVKKSLK